MACGCDPERSEKAVQAMYLLSGAAEDPALADYARARLNEAIDRLRLCDWDVAGLLLEVEAPSHVRFVIRQALMIIQSTGCSRT